MKTQDRRIPLLWQSLIKGRLSDRVSFILNWLASAKHDLFSLGAFHFMLAELKPYLTALVMPPCSLILLMILGWLMLGSKKYMGRGKGLIALAILALGLLSSSNVAIWLNNQLLPQYAMISGNEALKSQAGAIVVLGGGVEMDLPDGVVQLQSPALDRLRYAVELHRKTHIPLLVSGGKGWGAKTDFESEANVSQRVANEAFGVEVKWLESQAHDTQESALNTFKLLQAQGISKIVLVTHAWHMPRSTHQFEAAGFEVLPAPMGHITGSNEVFLQSIPSAGGLRTSLIVLREALGMLVMNLKS
jgi:uncharacterized SAM-binding protein YcdF (DUF218 family)